MIVSGCVLVCLFLACVEIGGSLGLKGAELPDLSPFRVVVDAMRSISAQLIDSGPFVSVQRPGEICFQPRDASGKHLLLPVHFADPLSYQGVACSLRDVIRLGGAYWQDNP